MPATFLLMVEGQYVGEFTPPLHVSPYSMHEGNQHLNWYCRICGDVYAQRVVTKPVDDQPVRHNYLEGYCRKCGAEHIPYQHAYFDPCFYTIHELNAKWQEPAIDMLELLYQIDYYAGELPCPNL